MTQRAGQPGKPMPWRDRLQKLRRLSPEAAPFFLRPERLPDGREPFIERERARADEVMTLSFAGLFFGSVLALVAFIATSMSGTVLFGAFAAILLGCSGFAFVRAVLHRGRRRLLWFDPHAQAVITETVTRCGRTFRRVETPIDHCALLLHPLASDPQSPNHITDFAAVVHLGGATDSDRFVLACGSRPDIVEGYIDDCPDWLRDIHEGDGPTLNEPRSVWLGSWKRHRLDRGHCPRCGNDLAGRFITGCTRCD